MVKDYVLPKFDKLCKATGGKSSILVHFNIFFALIFIEYLLTYKYIHTCTSYLMIIHNNITYYYNDIIIIKLLATTSSNYVYR